MEVVAMNYLKYSNHKLIQVFVFSLFLLVVNGAFANEMPFKELVNDVRSALILAEQQIEEETKLPKIKSASLKAAVSVSEKLDGGLNLIVFKLGAEKKKSVYSHIKITYKRPDPAKTTPTSGMSQSLAEAIVKASRAVKSAYKIDDDLLLKTVEVSIKFAMIENSSGAIEFSIADSVGIDIGGSVSSDNLHQITIVFED